VHDDSIPVSLKVCLRYKNPTNMDNNNWLENFRGSMTSINGNNKRKREEEVLAITCSEQPSLQQGHVNANGHITEKSIQTSRKKQAQEGFSWWTCLQLGISMENSKPQPSQSTNFDR